MPTPADNKQARNHFFCYTMYISHDGVRMGV